MNLNFKGPEGSFEMNACSVGGRTGQRGQKGWSVLFFVQYQTQCPLLVP